MKNNFEEINVLLEDKNMSVELSNDDEDVQEEREIFNSPSLSDDQAIDYIAGCISKKVYIFLWGWIFYFSFSVRFCHYTALRLDGSSEPRRTIRSNGDGGV